MKVDRWRGCWAKWKEGVSQEQPVYQRGNKKDYEWKKKQAESDLPFKIWQHSLVAAFKVDEAVIEVETDENGTFLSLS